CLSTCPLVVAPPPPPSRSPYTTLFRSGGKDAGGVVHAKDHFAVLIAGVGGRLHRDEVLALLGDGVQLVEPVGHVGGGGAGPQDQVAVEPVLDQGGGAGQALLTENGLAVELGVVQHARLVGHDGVARGGAGRAHPPVRDEQLGDLLVGGQGLDISGGALGGGKAPVVDGGHFAGAVDVLKGEAVFLDDAAGHRADGGAVGVVVIFQVVGCFFCHEAFLLLTACVRGALNPMLLLLSHKAPRKGKDYFAGNPYNFFILPDFAPV